MDPRLLIERIAARGGGPKPLQIYLHVPFCASKCHFCDWVDDIPTAQLTAGRGVRGRYVDALCRQIEFWGPQLTAIGYQPNSIYWGGGTPTRLDVDQLDRIGATLGAAFDLNSLRQHTLEGMPNDVTDVKLECLASIGVNRLSLGVQSFDPEQLRRSGRAHSVDQAIRAVKLAQTSGIADVNIDLISGFPDETASTFRKTLDVAVALDLAHISVYSYRATPRTTMALQVNRGVRQALVLDDMIESYEMAREALVASGYDEYCLSYFCKEDRFQFEAGLYGYTLAGDIVGFGAGASSILGGLSLRNDDAPLHRFLEYPLDFASVTPFSLERPDMLFPLFGGALMTRTGLCFDKFESVTGIPFSRAWTSSETKAWFQYVQNCGAQLSFQEDRIVCEQRSSLHRVYLRNLAYTLNPALGMADGGAR